jgi:hypothetical protein
MPLKLKTLSPMIWLGAALALLMALTVFGPAEKTLGTNIRVVYLHGVLVWTALVGFGAAALAGAAGLWTRRLGLQRWSQALGRTGLLFWVIYLPVSLWAMQANWNGLFLAEPRWRLGLIFAVAGLFLQSGLALIGSPALSSFSNIAYLLALAWALSATPMVMHPPAPMLNSKAPRIQAFFFALLGVTLLAGWQVARWWQAAKS